MVFNMLINQKGKAKRKNKSWVQHYDHEGTTWMIKTSLSFYYHFGWTRDWGGRTLSIGYDTKIIIKI